MTAHRFPTLHYVEAVLPRGFHRIGLDVKVITSDLVAPASRKFIGKTRFYGPDGEDFEVIRLACLDMGNLALPNPLKLKGLVRSLEPDALFCMAPTKGLPFYPFLWDGPPIFTQIGEHMPVRGVKKSLKKWAYTRMVERSAAVFITKIESQDFLNGLLGRQVETHPVFLPFDEEIFYWDPEERERTRRELGVEGPLIVSASMITPHKKYEALVDAVAQLRATLLLVGLLKTDAYASKLASYAREKLGSRFISMPFLPQERLRPIFNAGDVGVWTWTSVAVKQALGTGLPVVMWKPRHLIEEGVQGYYFEERETGYIKSALSKALDRSWDREELYRIGVSKYSSVAIAKLIHGLMKQKL